MIRTIRQTVTQEIDVTIEIRCNACGRSWPRGPEVTPDPREPEITEFVVTGGYGNDQWGDEVRLRWHACEDCIAKWIESFAAQPDAFFMDFYVTASIEKPVPFKFYGRPGVVE